MEQNYWIMLKGDQFAHLVSLTDLQIEKLEKGEFIWCFKIAKDGTAKRFGFSASEITKINEAEEK